MRHCLPLICLAALLSAERADAQRVAAFRDCADCPEMAVVPAGHFTMGSSASEQSWAASHGATRQSVSDESPQHAVALRSFALGKYDVTRGEYAAFVRETGYPAGDGCYETGNPNAIKHAGASWQNPGFSQTDRDPVVCVSWQDAKAYVSWLNSKARRPQSTSGDGPYRLPSESEWEYAARAGTTTRFWWGDDDSTAPDHAWYKDNAGGRTHPVGLKPANAFGLYDVTGNVWQWTEDCYADTHADAPVDGSARETGTACLRVDRGGSWFYPAWLLRSATRERNPAGYRDAVMGFRVARTLADVDSLGPEVRKYVRVSAPKVVLEHVQIIDGTGAAPSPDQNITIEGGRITAISPGADQAQSDGTTILDLRGYSVMPGIVGMHDHLFYMARPNLGADYSSNGPALFLEMSFSAPRLYLANGVTTVRTVGSVEPYTDVRLQHAIETGILPGPHLDVTGPYLEGSGTNPNLQMHQLTGPEDARQTVAYWADRGVTSFKAYTHITREELRAAVREAHQRGLKVTGHLCSVTYAEAAELGIDNLEHGFFVNTEMDPDKQPDTCSASGGDYTLEHMVPGSAEADRLIGTLIQHHVAITSTLPGTAAAVSLEALRPAVLAAMSPSAREAYFYGRNQPRSTRNVALLLRRDMDLERAFVAAGGLLLAGADPVGNGGVIPGFGDQREIELLVEAGFAPVQAIRIATLNGAIFLGRQDQIGSIAVGKRADLVVMRGDPATRIADIENVEIVFKDGVGYDTARLLESVKGRYGEY